MQLRRELRRCVTRTALMRTLIWWDCHFPISRPVAAARSSSPAGRPRLRWTTLQEDAVNGPSNHCHSRTVGAAISYKASELPPRCCAAIVFLIHEGRIGTFAKDDGLSLNDVTSIYEDREGSIWGTTLLEIATGSTEKFSKEEYRQSTVN